MDADSPVMRPLGGEDALAALAVINAAARWYAEFLPAEQAAGPEMTLEQWHAEAERMRWFGADLGGALIGVVGLEPVGEVVLLRHWYVDPARQRGGIGSRLRAHAEQQSRDAGWIIAGTYAANYKARGALERAGYRLSADPQAVLRAYYDITEARLAASVTYERAL